MCNGDALRNADGFDYHERYLKTTEKLTTFIVLDHGDKWYVGFTFHWLLFTACIGVCTIDVVFPYINERHFLVVMMRDP